MLECEEYHAGLVELRRTRARQESLPLFSMTKAEQEQRLWIRLGQLSENEEAARLNSKSLRSIYDSAMLGLASSYIAKGTLESRQLPVLRYPSVASSTNTFAGCVATALTTWPQMAFARQKPESSATKVASSLYLSSRFCSIEMQRHRGGSQGRSTRHSVGEGLGGYWCLVRNQKPWLSKAYSHSVLFGCRDTGHGIGLSSPEHRRSACLPRKASMCED